MKNIKKIIAGSLVFAMLLTVTACNKKEPEAEDNKPSINATGEVMETKKPTETTPTEPEETTANNEDLLTEPADESDINSRLVPPIKNTAPEGVMNKIYIRELFKNITVDSNGRPQEPYLEYDLLKGISVADIMDNWHSSKGSMMGRYRVDDDMLYFFGEWFGDDMGLNMEITENGEIVTDGYYDKDENWIKGTYDKTKTDKYIIKGISIASATDFKDFVKIGGFEDDKVIRVGDSRSYIESLVGTGYEREGKQGLTECYYKNSTMSMFVLYSGSTATRITLIVNETIK